MEKVFYTLHDFMLRTESITYILTVVALCGFIFFWRFLSERDDDAPEQTGEHSSGKHHH